MNEKQELKYSSRVNSQIALTDEERIEIAKRIIKFMRECLVIEDYIHEPESKYQTRFKLYRFDFAGYTFGSYYFRVYEKDGVFKEIDNESLLRHFSNTGGYCEEGMFLRFKYHIRMNGNSEYIYKLIELLGNKVAFAYLDSWAKKNMLVAIKLQEIMKVEEIVEGEK